MPRPGRLVARARLLGPWRALCLVLVLAYALSVLSGQQAQYSLPIDGVLYTAAYAACAACCAARARRAGDSASVWRLLAIGIGLYALGWAAAAYWLVHDAVQPIPSIADVGWLAFYPLTFAAFIQVMRRLRIDRSSVLTLLDAVVAGLGAAAVCASIVLPALATSGNTSWPVTVTDAAYPCGDLLLLGVVVATLLAARFNVPPTVWVINAAIVVLIGGDSAYLTDVASGAITWGTWVNVAGVIALGAVSMCAGARFVARPASDRPSWLVHAVPPLASLSSLVILLLRAHGPFEPIVAGLAALTVAVAVVRLMLSYHEARALADSRQLAQSDELTGLLNRRGFQALAAAALSKASTPLAVLLVDLDGFKDINDSLGHPAGDDLLRALGGRLRTEGGSFGGPSGAGLVARIGGDEFAVLTDDRDDAAANVAARILATVKRPFYLHNMELRVDASIGIASSPQHGTNLDDLLRHADIAMYKAKAGHDGVLRYSPEAERNSGSLRAIAQLRFAIEHEPAQLVLHYQPKVNLLSGQLAGVEALVRWNHPERGFLMPGQFLSLAEKGRMMSALSDRVLQRALAELPTWHGELRGQTVAVNLPADAVSDPTLVERVSEMLESTGTPAHRLQLEITEDFLMADLAGARVVLEKLRLLGVGISIDDYGTGYSSLAYLRDLPVDELKLDRAFVQPILADRRAAAIVRSTIELAHSLGLRMVAEGIEDADTWHLLLAMGCDVGQGYLFGRPQAGADLELALAEPTHLLSQSAAAPMVWPVALRSPA